MIPLIVVRPEPGCTATVARAQKMGLAAEAYPLFDVVPLPWSAPPRSAVDALLIGSANAVRLAGPALEGFRGMPVYPVGAVTAEACTAAGLRVVRTGRGGLQDVLGQLDPVHRRLLRLAGAERIALEVPGGIHLTERVVYEVKPRSVGPSLFARLAEPAVVLLHSAAAARHFASECDRLQINRCRLALATIGERVTVAAGNRWRTVASAPRRDDTALLALAAEMCHTLGQ